MYYAKHSEKKNSVPISFRACALVCQRTYYRMIFAIARSKARSSLYFAQFTE